MPLEERAVPADPSGIADFTRVDVAHLLRRAGFGGRKADIDALVALPTWVAVVDRVLTTTANPADPIPVAVDDTVDLYHKPWVASVHHWMDRMATSPTPIVEKMTLFWHGHLTTSVNDVLPRLVHRQIRTYRANSLGDLHTLLQAMAVDPAMLGYLNGGSNVVKQPNENFGREVLELFTLGNGQFSESDVTAMARAWTGHNLTDDRQRYVFRPLDHDGGSKTLFGITRNWDGPATITEIVRGSRQQACARHLAGRIWAFFAYPNPSAALVDQLAAAFIASGMNIKALLRAIFLRPEFRLASTRTALVRSPVEWLVAAMRHTGMSAAEIHPEWWLERIGQRLLAPPNVAGWRGGEAWISTSSQWAKGAFVKWVRWEANTRGVLAGTAAMTPATAVSTAFAQYGIDQPSALTRQRLEQFVAGEKAGIRDWSVSVNLTALTLLSPDFQLA